VTEILKNKSTFIMNLS